jgi:hypothetical protein
MAKFKNNLIFISIIVTVSFAVTELIIGVIFKDRR